MKSFPVSAIVLVASIPCYSESRHFATAAETPVIRPAAVQQYDTVIPQLVDGEGWQTSIVLTNLDSVPRFYQVTFVSDDARLMAIPLPEAPNGATGINGSMAPNSTLVFASTGTSPTLRQGWALVITLDRSAQEAGASAIASKVAGYAVFRQRVQGRPDYEAAVPIGSRFDTRFTIPFDNRAGLSTGVALVNPDTQQSSAVSLTARSHDGAVLRSDTFTIEPGFKLVFSAPERYSELAGKHGVLQISTTGRMLSGLGLRFNSTGPFTATPVLSLP